VENLDLGDVNGRVAARPIELLSADLTLSDGRTWIVIGALAQMDDPWKLLAPEVREPDRIDGWSWIEPDERPSPVYPASALVLEHLVRLAGTTGEDALR
jgi:hypothetical protein